jgi:hypothetical protein
MANPKFTAERMDKRVLAEVPTTHVTWDPVVWEGSG